MSPIAMFDDVNVSLIPKDAQAVAGYVNGRFTTWPQVVRQFPNAHKLSIAVTSSADADCLDVEPGDATPEVAAQWVKRQQGRGVKRPVVYTSVSSAQTLLAMLAKAGIKRTDVRLWTAHYTHSPHLCGPSCGFGLKTTADATQWTDKALGRSLDESLCSDSFFGPKPQPAVNKRKIASWRTALRYVQGVLRRPGLDPTLRRKLQAYAQELRKLLRGGK